MRKFIIAALAASALVPAAASATDRSEVRRGQQEVRGDQREVRRHIANGDYHRAQQARQETREDRRELREDWRDYRKSHRQVYQRGAYVAPVAYRYRPVNPGYRFAPAQVGSRYWLNNYSAYRLPHPGYGRRWVRYGNDAVLVDARSNVARRIVRAFFL